MVVAMGAGTGGGDMLSVVLSATILHARFLARPEVLRQPSTLVPSAAERDIETEYGEWKNFGSGGADYIYLRSEYPV